MSDDLLAAEREESLKTLGLACRLSNVLDSLKSFAEFLSEPEAPAEVVATRQTICQNCTATDSDGKKLFRPFHKGVFTCGEILLKNPLRIPAKDGCGCILNLKWRGKSQSCPLNLWPALMENSKPVKRCCGRK